jgi:release factor glutamine methyltransferase
VLAVAVQKLQAAGIESARFEAQLLLAHALGVSRTVVLAGTYAPPTEAQRQAFERLIAERTQRIPLAYLRGTQEFYGLEFEVSPAVLIPRPETELLVEFAREKLPQKEPSIFADVGTGSGCIAVSVLRYCPAAHAIATDLSADALNVARNNVTQHDVAERVHFVQNDTLAGVSGPLDLVLSNPPYIPTGELATLQPEIRDCEPRLALDGGAEGIQIYPPLATQALTALRPGGWLAVEVGIGQATPVADLFARIGYAPVEIRRDLAGIERIVCGQKRIIQDIRKQEKYTAWT